MSLAQVNLKDIRMMTIQGRTIQILLAGECQLEFNYETEEQLRADLSQWAGEYTDSTSWMPFDLRILPDRSK